MFLPFDYGKRTSRGFAGKGTCDGRREEEKGCCHEGKKGGGNVHFEKNNNIRIPSTSEMLYKFYRLGFDLPLTYSMWGRRRLHLRSNSSHLQGTMDEFLCSVWDR